MGPEATGWDGRDEEALLDMMRSMLVFRPGERAFAADVVRSKWMVK